MTREKRLEIWQRDGGICQVCFQVLPFDRQMHVDHIFPVVFGGCDHPENLRATHGPCNLRRPRSQRGSAPAHCSQVSHRRIPSTPRTGEPRKVKATPAVTREQWAWLRARADRKGRTSISAVIREMIDEVRAAERAQSAEGERVA
jgi:hypothetical protein